MDRTRTKSLGGSRAARRLPPEQVFPASPNGRQREKDVGHKVRTRSAAPEESADLDRRKRPHVPVVLARAGRALQLTGSVLSAKAHLHLLRHRARCCQPL